jgi:hypothetical protein
LLLLYEVEDYEGEEEGDSVEERIMVDGKR